MIRDDYLNWKAQKVLLPCRAEVWDPQPRPSLWGTGRPLGRKRVIGSASNGGRDLGLSGDFYLFLHVPIPLS